MLRSIAVTALALTLTAMPASANVDRPSASHQGQWWTNSLGCEYSRAGTPGETMWFLIVNTAKKGCPTYYKVSSSSSVYQDMGPKI